MDEHIEVFCLVLPSGQCLWFETGNKDGYLESVISKWKSENPEYMDTKCTLGAVIITMPRDKYYSIQARHGSDEFNFPE